MRKVIILSLIFFVVFGYGLVLSQIQPNVIPEELEPANYPNFFDYRGVTNVHTDRGVGSGSTAEVIQAAQDVGLDYLFITDLNVFDLEPISEGYHRQLLVLGGGEYSYLESRLLTYDLQRRHEVDNLAQVQTLFADLLSQDGEEAKEDLLVLAHPSKPGFSWTGPYPTGLDGLEVINLKSVWQKAWTNSKFSFFWSALIYPFNPQLALLRLYEEPQEELDLWDQLSAKHRAVGFAGTDASAKTGSANGFYLKFPSYQRLFSLMSNHILLRSELTGDVDGDRTKLLNALSRGQFYFSLDILGNPKGFNAYIQEGEKISTLGTKLKWTPGMKIVTHLPKKPSVPYETKFIKDGQEIMASNSVDSEYEIHGKGTYRVIVRVAPTLSLPDGKRWITWIYTNPFYVQ